LCRSLPSSAADDGAHDDDCGQPEEEQDAGGHESPDRRARASRKASFTAEVWTMNTDGSQKRRVYHSACCVGSWAPPIWSPDGTKIAFAADSAHGTFMVDADGTNLRQLSGVSANGLTWQRLP
jgi:hypothetical protein